MKYTELFNYNPEKDKMDFAFLNAKNTFDQLNDPRTKATLQRYLITKKDDTVKSAYDILNNFYSKVAMNYGNLEKKPDAEDHEFKDAITLLLLLDDAVKKDRTSYKSGTRYSQRNQRVFDSIDIYAFLYKPFKYKYQQQSALNNINNYNKFISLLKKKQATSSQPPPEGDISSSY